MAWICDKNGNHRCEIKQLSYNGTFMGVSSITVTVESPAPIAFAIGDYIDWDYDGLRYTLDTAAGVEKQARRNSVGNAFLYENLVFLSPLQAAQNADFFDVILGNTNDFLTNTEFSFYGTAWDYAKRLEANLCRLYGSGTWKVRIWTNGTCYDATPATGIGTGAWENKLVDVSGIKCLGGFQQIYDLWGCAYVFSVVSGVNYVDFYDDFEQYAKAWQAGGMDKIFAYGKGNGLYKIRHTPDADHVLVTRLRPYGSGDNIPANYYLNSEDYHIEGNESSELAISHLMLPASQWTKDGIKHPSNAYLEQNTDLYGVREGVMLWDGSDPELGEIKPSIYRLSIQDLLDLMAAGDSYRPDEAKWPDTTQRIDKIITGAVPTDNGVKNEAGYDFTEIESSGSLAEHSFGTGGAYIDVEFNDLVMGTTPSVSHLAEFRIVPTSENKVAASFDVQASVASAIRAVNAYLTPYVGGVKISDATYPCTVTKEAISNTVDGITYTKRYKISLLDSTGNPIVFSSMYTGDVTFRIVAHIDFIGNPTGFPVVRNEYAVSFNLVRGNKAIDEYFSVTIPQIGFDLAAAVANGAKLCMRSGANQPREFAIVPSSVRYLPDTDTWYVRCKRSVDQSISTYFPNSNSVIATGDEYYLTGIVMPPLYVEIAAQKLLTAATAWLNLHSKPRMLSAVDVDNKIMAVDGIVLKEGMSLPISDTDLGIQPSNQESRVIDNIRIEEGTDAIRTFSVTLRDKKEKSALDAAIRGATSNFATASSVNEAVNKVVNTGHDSLTGRDMPNQHPISAITGLEDALLSSRFFEIGSLSSLVQLKAAYSYLGTRLGLLFDVTPEADVASSPAHLMLRNLGTAANPNYALYTPLPLITGGDQIIGDGTPGGGGGGGGASYIYELKDTLSSWIGRPAVSEMQVLVFDPSANVHDKNGNNGAWKYVNASSIGGVTSVVEQTGAVTAAQIATALTSAGYKLTDHEYSNGYGLNLSNGEFSLTQAVRNSLGLADNALQAASIKTMTLNVGTATVGTYNPIGASNTTLTVTAQNLYDTIGSTKYHPFGGENDASSAKTFYIGGALFTWHPQVGTTPGYLELNSALVTGGDQIVVSGTPGQGGGGGGAGYLYELDDVNHDSDKTVVLRPNNQPRGDGDVLSFNSSLGVWVALQKSSLLSGYALESYVDSEIWDSIQALNLGAASTYGVGAVASGNNGLVTGGSVYSAINDAVSSALKFQGTTTTAISDGSTTNPIVIGGSSYTAKKGDVVLYDGREFLWTGSAWEQLGDEVSWALKTTTISAGAGLTGGGTLAANRTISLNQDSIDKLALAATAYQKPSGGIPNSDIATPWVKVGTTQISLGGQQTSLAGLVNVAMSGKLTIGSAEIEWVAGENGNPGYLKINQALLTTGDQIVNSGTPGQGGGGSVPYLHELQDVTITNVGTGNLLQWNGSAWVNVAANTVGVTTLASASAPGLMSASDYSKLYNIEANANNYSLPLADNGTRGGIQVGFTTSAANRNYAVQLSSEKAYVNVPWVEYSAGTAANVSGADTTAKVWSGSVLKSAIEAYPGVNKTGTVTEVKMTVPTGLSVSGSPITTSGTLAVTFATGYSIPTTAKQSNWDTAYGWGNHASAGYLLASTAQSTYQPLDANLTAIAALTGPTSGQAFLKRNSDNTWVLDTNTYLTGNQTITLSGDVSGSGTTSIQVSIGTGKVTNAMLAGSIANGKLANSAITINGSSTSLGGSFNTASITAGTAGTSSATSGYTLAVPYVTMNKYGIVTAYGTHTHTVNNIPNSSLANSSITVGTTAISLGGSATSLAGLVNVSMSGKLTIGSAEIEWVAGENGNPGYLKVNQALLTVGDQIVNSGTPGGGGGGGGAGFLYELGDVLSDSGHTVVKQYDGSTNAAPNNLFAFNGSKWYALKLGTNLAISNGTLNATNTTYSNGTGLALSNGVFSITSAYQTDIANGASAYSTLTTSQSKNKVLASPSNESGAPSFRALVAADLPSIENLTNFSTRVYDATTSRTANYVLAAPNGSNGAATFRKLVAADIPSLTVSKITDIASSYVSIATANTITAKHTFSNGILLNTASSWTSSDRAIAFSADGEDANIRYYNTDSNKGLTFNPNTGELKAAKFTRRGGTSSQFLKADGSVDSNTYLTGNQTITLSGDVSGSGTTSINVSIGSGKVTNAMLAGSIANGKLANSAITINGSSASLGGSFNTASITAGTAGTSSATSGLSISVPYVTMNAYGIVTGYGTHTHSISKSDLTTALEGGSGYYVKKAGDTMSGDLIIEKTGGGLTIRGERLDANADGGYIYLAGRYYDNDRNGVKIAAEYPGSVGYDIQDLVIYTSYNRSGNASPVWQEAMRIAAQGQTFINGQYTYSLYIDNNASGATSAGIRFRTEGTTIGGIFVNSSNDLYFSAGTSSTASKVLTADNYDGYALPLAGGTMTGSIKLPNGSYINAASGYTMLGIGSGGETFYCGPGAEITNAFYIRSGNINLTHVKAGTNYTIWDASNSNLSTVDWAANNLTVAGTSTFSDTMYVENRKYMQWKDSGGTYRNIFGLNNTNELLIGYGLTSVTGSVVAIYGETVRLNTGMTELVQANGATLMLAGTGVNTGGSKILFRSSNTSDQNGFKIEAEAAASSSNRGRLALNFYSSNNTTSPYAPDWKRAMRISYNGNIMFGNTASGSEFYPTVYSYGPLQVGTSTTNKNLTVYGSITSSGDQVISSDATKKKNWRDLKYGVADIAKATAGVFDWKDGKGESAGTKAQDWMHLVPQLVHGEEGHMTLAYGQIAMLNTILLARRSEDHETRIKALELENAELRKEIERLRS